MFRIRCSGGGFTRTILRAGSSSMLAANSRKLRERYGRFDPANPGKRQAIPRSRCSAAMLKTRSSGRAILNRAGSCKNSTSSCSLFRRARMASMPWFAASAGSIAWSDRSMTFSCGKFSCNNDTRKDRCKAGPPLQPAWSAKHAAIGMIFSRPARQILYQSTTRARARRRSKPAAAMRVRRVATQAVVLCPRSHRGQLAISIAQPENFADVSA